MLCLSHCTVDALLFLCRTDDSYVYHLLARNSSISFSVVSVWHRNVVELVNDKGWLSQRIKKQYSTLLSKDLPVQEETAITLLLINTVSGTTEIPGSGRRINRSEASDWQFHFRQITSTKQWCQCSNCTWTVSLIGVKWRSSDKQESSVRSLDVLI